MSSAEPIYPQVQRITPLLATLGSRADVTLFLSIRSFDTQLPSAYVQELKVMPPIAGGFDTIRAPGAGAAAELVRDGAPDPRRRTRDPAPGLAPGGLSRPRRGDPRRALRPRRGRAAARRSRTRPGPARRISRRSRPPRRCRRRCPKPSGAPQVRAIFAASGDGARFQPFSDEERRLLRAAYADDLDQIAGLGSRRADAVLRRCARDSRGIGGFPLILPPCGAESLPLTRSTFRL